jgi:tRNA-2-methylthio-N6-dimethylallyladenosine synthase
MKNQIPEKVKNARLQELQSLLREQQTAFNRSFVGKTVSVLFDDNGQHKKQVFGRTPFMQPTFVAAPGGVRERVAGREVDVKIMEAVMNNLKGEVVA